MSQVLVLARGPLDRDLERSQRRSACREFVEVVGSVDVEVVAAVAAASVLVVCSENHPRATPGEERRRSWSDVKGRKCLRTLATGTTTARAARTQTDVVVGEGKGREM